MKKYILGASSPWSWYLFAFGHSYGRELKFLTVLLVLFFTGISHIQNNSQKFSLDLVDMVSLYKVQVIEHTPFYSTPLIEKSLKKKNINIDVEELISTSMSYSYSETQLGFYLKDFKFFDKNPKAVVEKKILKTLPRSLSIKARKYVRAVLMFAQKHQVDPIWVLSVMWTESHFNFKAISSAGARGLMQIMPETKKFIYIYQANRGRKLSVEQDNFDINDYYPYKITDSEYKEHVAKLINIELGIIYLKNLLKYFNKNHTYATVAYNMGPGWTRQRLRNKLPVGEKNLYLDKVQQAYKRIVRKI